jgi:hypothetical protein
MVFDHHFALICQGRDPVRRDECRKPKAGERSPKLLKLELQKDIGSGDLSDQEKELVHWIEVRDLRDWFNVSHGRSVADDRAKRTLTQPLFGGRMKGLRGSLAALVILAAACSSSSTSATTSTKPSTVAPSGLYSAAQAKAALLTIGDMPTGWATFVVPATKPSTTTGACEGPNVAEITKNASAETIAYAQDPQTGPAFSDELYVFPSIDAAKAAMSTFRTISAKCTSFTATDSSGKKEPATIGALSFAAVGGDDSMGTRLTIGKTGGPQVINDIATVRKANVVFNIELVGFSPDTDTFTQLTTKAVAKLGPPAK